MTRSAQAPAQLRLAGRAVFRPQALAAGALPVSAGFTGVWMDPARSGEGLSLQVDDAGTVVVQWNTYDMQRRQMWLAGSAQAGADGVVRVPLVLPFAKETVRAKLPANLAARETLPLPVWTARLDLTLPAG